MNVMDLWERLCIVICMIVDMICLSILLDYVDRDILYWIVVVEGSKVYYIKLVDEENNKGFFLIYKCLFKKIVGIILDVNFSFCYVNILVSNLLEMGNN